MLVYARSPQDPCTLSECWCGCDEKQQRPEGDTHHSPFLPPRCDPISSCTLTDGVHRQHPGRPAHAPDARDQRAGAVVHRRNAAAQPRARVAAWKVITASEGKSGCKYGRAKNRGIRGRIWAPRNSLEPITRGHVQLWVMTRISWRSHEIGFWSLEFRGPVPRNSGPVSSVPLSVFPSVFAGRYRYYPRFWRRPVGPMLSE